MAEDATPKPDSSKSDAAKQAEDFRRAYLAVRKQIQNVIVGQSQIIDGVLTCLFVGGHALLEGVPGLGKTLLDPQPQPGGVARFRTHPVYARPYARRHHRHHGRRRSRE